MNQTLQAVIGIHTVILLVISKLLTRCCAYGHCWSFSFILFESFISDSTLSAYLDISLTLHLFQIALRFPVIVMFSYLIFLCVMLTFWRSFPYSFYYISLFCNLSTVYLILENFSICFSGSSECVCCLSFLNHISVGCNLSVCLLHKSHKHEVAPEQYSNTNQWSC